MGSLTEKVLERLRRIFCTCDDESICYYFRAKGLTKNCEESCPSFCKMWAELQKLLEVA